MTVKNAMRAMRVVGLLLGLWLAAVPPARAQALSVDANQLKQQIRDLVIEKLASDISQAAEGEVRSATYFDELLREFAPVGLESTSFTQEAVSLYREYQDAVAQDASAGGRENVRNLLRQRLGQAIVASLDAESQEIVSDLQGLYSDAAGRLKALTDATNALQENPQADVAETLRSFGLDGTVIDDVEFLEVNYNAAMDRYGAYADYYAIFDTLRQGMASRNPGAKLDALFTLGAEYGGKIPVLGKFVELYAKVAQEMISAVGRLGGILRARQGYCLGVGTTGHIPSKFVDERNQAFSAAYPGVERICPFAKVGLYHDVYYDEGAANNLYFWTSSGFVKGAEAHGGIADVRALVVWLRKHGESAKAQDVAFIARAYNIAPGFLERERRVRKLAQETAQEVRRLASELVTCSVEERRRILLDEGELIPVLQALEQDTDGLEHFPYVEDIVDKVIEERILEGKVTLWAACSDAHERLERLRAVLLSGRVVDGSGQGLDGVSVSVSSGGRLLQGCSRLTSERGNVSAQLLAGRDDALELTVSASDSDLGSDEEKVAVSARQVAASCTLTLGEEEEPELASLSLTPSEKTLAPGASVRFGVVVLDTEGRTVVVPRNAIRFDGAPDGVFVAQEEGTFSVTATYQSLSGSAVVTVSSERPECPENEVWNEKTRKCECQPPFVENEERRCVDVGTLVEEVGEDEGDLCDPDTVRASFGRLGDLATEIRSGAAAIDNLATKFQKEVNDRAAEVCGNGIAAYCYYSANGRLTAVEDARSSIEELSTEIIMTLGICPDLAGQMGPEGVSVSGVVSTIGGLGSEAERARRAVEGMQARLDQEGCDEQEVSDLGQSVMPPGADPDFLQQGGSMGEIAGDGVDNDADGLQDEAVEGLAGYNITLVLFDSGSAKDDSFGLSVSGYGNLGTTPPGGLRSYGLNLPPGSYTATVTVVSAPDNEGTFTLVVLQNGTQIAALSGSPPPGAVAELPFTVTAD